MSEAGSKQRASQTEAGQMKSSKRSRGTTSKLNDEWWNNKRQWLNTLKNEKLPTDTVQIFKITINNEDFVMMKERDDKVGEFQRIPKEVMDREFKHEKTHNDIDNIFAPQTKKDVSDLDFLEQLQLQVKSVKNTSKRLR